MKTNLRKLHLLFALSFLEPDMFYNISVTEYGIILQGHYAYSVVYRLKNKGADVIIADSGITTCSKGNITINLT